MPTTRISTLTGDGRTGTNLYADFAAWAASFGSLTADDIVQVLEVEHKAGGHPIAAGTSLTQATDTTRYIEIRNASGHGHTGVADTGKAHFVGAVSAANTCLLQVQTNKVRIVGMQFLVTSSGASSVGAIGAWATGTNGLTEIDRCIVNCKGGTGRNSAIWASAGGTGGKTVITNTLIHEQEYASNTNFTDYLGIYHNAGDLVVMANTFARCGEAIRSTNPAGKTAHIRGCLVYGTGTQAATASAITILTGGSSHNASSQSTGLGGTSARTSQTFTFRATGSYKLAAADTGALGFGADLSADATWPVPTADGGGQTRTGTWDIGFDQRDPAGSITITGPTASTIGRGGKMRVTATKSGATSGIQRRVVLAGTSTVVSGYDWATAGSLVGDAYTLDMTGLQDGGWYECQLRFADDTAVTATSPRFGEGRWIMNAGQSNGLYQLSGSSYGGVVANDKLRTYGISVTHWSLPVPPGGCETGNAIIAANGGVPVLIINAAVGGTAISAWQPGQTYYTQMMAQLTALAPFGSGLDLLLWDQGEQEAQAGTTVSAHTTALQTIISQVRTDLSLPNLPVIVGSLSTISTPFTSSDANWNAVNRALKDVGTTNANCLWVNRADLAVSDGVHLGGAGQQAYGKRRGRAALVALGLATGYRGPRIRKIDRISATVYDVQLTHVLGTDVTPSSGITGFTVLDPSAGNAALTVSSVARTGASTVRITLSAGPAVNGTQPLFSYLRGPTATISAPLLDNSANTLPLEYTYEQASRTKATQIVETVNVDGAAAANLTNLKGAVWDVATPDLIAGAPLTTFANETTDASGQIVIDISMGDMDAGQAAWLTLTTSNGDPSQSPVPKTFGGPVTVA